MKKKIIRKFFTQKSQIINNFVRNLKPAVACLMYTDANINPDTQLYANNKIGQLWDVNDQCKLMFGLNATFCQVRYNYF